MSLSVAKIIWKTKQDFWLRHLTGHFSPPPPPPIKWARDVTHIRQRSWSLEHVYEDHNQILVTTGHCPRRLPSPRLCKRQRSRAQDSTRRSYSNSTNEVLHQELNEVTQNSTKETPLRMLSHVELVLKVNYYTKCVFTGNWYSLRRASCIERTVTVVLPSIYGRTRALSLKRLPKSTDKRLSAPGNLRAKWTGAAVGWLRSYPDHVTSLRIGKLSRFKTHLTYIMRPMLASRPFEARAVTQFVNRTWQIH